MKTVLDTWRRDTWRDTDTWRRDTSPGWTPHLDGHLTWMDTDTSPGWTPTPHWMDGLGRLWPKPTLAKTDFGQNSVWPNSVWPNSVWPSWPNRVYCCVWCVVCGVCVVWCGVLCGVVACFTVSWSGVSRDCVGFKVLVWSCSVPPDHPSWDRPSPDRISPDRPSNRPSPGQDFRGCSPGPPCSGPSLPGPPKISLCYIPLLPQNSFLFSWNSGFRRPGPSNVHVRALGLSCESPAALGSSSKPSTRKDDL